MNRLIKWIIVKLAGNRPIMLNVDTSERTINIYGDNAFIDNVSIRNCTAGIVYHPLPEFKG